MSQTTQITDEEAVEEVADELELQPQRLESILSDVESVMADLAGMDLNINNPADLERVRTALPTEPHRAELLSAALPPALGNALEYVHESDRQSGYWRRSRERSDPEELSDAELRHRLTFVDTAIDQRGKDGTVRTDDGRQIPVAARKIGDRLDGASFDVDADRVDGDRDKGKAILNRITSWI